MSDVRGSIYSDVKISVTSRNSPLLTINFVLLENGH